MANFKVSAPAKRQRVEIEGLDKLIKDMESLGRKARTPLRQGMRQATKLVADEAKAEVSKTEGAGRVYEFKKGNRVKRYRASAPGEPPVKVEGRLRKSIKVEISKSGLSGRIKSSDPKAHVQEYGSVHQKERPFLRPALQKKKDEVLRILERAFRAGIALVFRSKK